MPEAQGTINLCLPAVVLNAILRRLISEGDRPRRRSKEAHARIRELMGDLRLGTLLQFPSVRLRASELTTLAPGTILRLPLSKYTASQLRVGGLPFSRAYPVRTGEHRGAQLEGECIEEISDIGTNAGMRAALGAGADVGLDTRLHGVTGFVAGAEVGGSVPVEQGAVN
jgi:flagellar motor switch protein FliM